MLMTKVPEGGGEGRRKVKKTPRVDGAKQKCGHNEGRLSPQQGRWGNMKKGRGIKKEERNVEACRAADVNLIVESIVCPVY